MSKFHLLSLITCITLIIGCSAPKNLTFHIGGTAKEIAYVETILEDFRKETGIEVTLIRTTTMTEQRKQSLLISLRGKKADPDVMLMDVAWIGQLASSGWLEPLEQHNIDRSLYFKRIIDLADVYDGKLLGVPLYVDGGMLYYRKDLLEQAGYDAPPQTWDQLRDMSLAVMKTQRPGNADFWGYVWQGAQYEGLVCNALEVFVSAGGGFFNGKNPILDTVPNVKALALMADMINKDKISPPNTYTDMKEDEVRLMFQNGNALFERNWPFAWAVHNGDDSKIKDKFGVAPLPHFEGQGSASTLGGWHAAISAFSDRKEDAARFVAYLTLYEVQKKLAMNLGWNPGRTDVYADAELNRQYPALAQFKSVFENAVPRPSVPYYSEISLVLQKYMNGALFGKMDAQTALTTAQGEVKKIVDANEK